MTPRDPEALQVAFRVLKTLEELGVAYHVGGSYASAIHGIPRQTHDVDLVVDVPQALVQRLVRDLEGEFYVDERAVARAVRDRTSVNLVHLGTGVKVDLFIKGTSEFDDSEFARRVLLRLGDDQPRDVFVKSAEDTMLRKLLWFRLGGEASDRAGREPRCPLPHPLGRTARNSRLAGPLDGGRLSAEDPDEHLGQSENPHKRRTIGPSRLFITRQRIAATR